MTTVDLSHVQALIFDYGGTLDTAARHWAHVLWEGFRHAEIPVSEALFREAYVHGERTLARQPIITPEDDFHVLLQKKTDIETAYLVQSGYWSTEEATRQQRSRQVADYCYAYARRTVAESRLVLDCLRGQYPMVLVSNFYGNIETILRDFGLADYFMQIVESAVVGVRKPDPAIYRLGVEATGLPAEAVLVVGDSYDKDVIPARAVGCRTAWLKGEGWTEECVDESVPDLILTSLSELPERLLGQR